MSVKPNVPSEITSRPQDAALHAWVQLARTYTKVQQQMAPVLSRHGLTSAKFDVLATLHLGEGIMQQELAARLLVTKGNVCGVLDRMEASGWIERRPIPEDRRVNLLYLTDAGRKVFAETLPEHHATIREVMARLQSGEIQTLQRLLWTLDDTLEE